MVQVAVDGGLAQRSGIIDDPRANDGCASSSGTVRNSAVRFEFVINGGVR